MILQYSLLTIFCLLPACLGDETIPCFAKKTVYTIINTGFNKADYDVRFEVDTQSMVASGDIAPTLRDVAFKVEDGPWCEYYFEMPLAASIGNTLPPEMNHVWVRIPDLQSGNTTLTMYTWCNDDAVETYERMMTGTFYSLHDMRSECVGETSVSQYSSSFLHWKSHEPEVPPGDESLGYFNGGLQTHGHVVHPQSPAQTVNIEGTVIYCSTSMGVLNPVSTADHEHYVDVTIVPATEDDAMPYYINYIGCKSNYFQYIDTSIMLLTANLSGQANITMIEHDRTRLLRFTNVNIRSGTGGGQPMHRHEFTATINQNDPSTTNLCGMKVPVPTPLDYDTLLVQRHAHLPPNWLRLDEMENKVPTVTTFGARLSHVRLEDIIADGIFLATSMPPLGFTLVDSPADDSYIVIGDSYGTVTTESHGDSGYEMSGPSDGPKYVEGYPGGTVGILNPYVVIDNLGIVVNHRHILGGFTTDILSDYDKSLPRVSVIAMKMKQVSSDIRVVLAENLTVIGEVTIRPGTLEDALELCESLLDTMNGTLLDCLGRESDCSDCEEELEDCLAGNLTISNSVVVRGACQCSYAISITVSIVCTMLGSVVTMGLLSCVAAVLGSRLANWIP